MEYALIDYIIMGVIGVSVIVGLVRGFVREALSLANWIIAIWVGFTYIEVVSNALSSHIASNTVRAAVSFFILFAVVLILGTLIVHLISQMVQKTGLSGTDRLLGTVFGFGRGVLLMAILLLLGGAMNFNEDEWWTSSTFIPKFEPMVEWLQGMLPDTFELKDDESSQDEES